MRGYTPLSPLETRNGIWAQVVLVDFNYTGKPPYVRIVNCSTSLIRLSDIKLSFINANGESIYSESHWYKRNVHNETWELIGDVLFLDIPAEGEVSIVAALLEQISGKYLMSVFNNTSYCLLNVCCQNKGDKGGNSTFLEIICKEGGCGSVFDHSVQEKKDHSEATTFH